jgi:hypothetical protein
VTGYQARARVPARPLADALAQEWRLVEELRRALRRQADGLATGDADAFDLATRAVARLQLTLDEARRCRVSLLWLLTGVPAVSLDTLEGWFDASLPTEVVAARDGVQRATAALEHEIARNRQVLAGTTHQASW